MEKLTLIFPDGKYENEDAVEKVIGYILRLNKPELVGGYGCYVSDEWDVARQFYRVKETYGKMRGKQIIHMIVSVDKGLLSLTEVKELAYRIAWYFGNERQVIFAVHDDTSYLHIHFGINTVAFTNGNYCAFFDQMKIKEYANTQLDMMVDRIWFKKDTGVSLSHMICGLQ